MERTACYCPAENAVHSFHTANAHRERPFATLLSTLRIIHHNSTIPAGPGLQKAKTNSQKHDWTANEFNATPTLSNQPCHRTLLPQPAKSLRKSNRPNCQGDAQLGPPRKRSTRISRLRLRHRRGVQGHHLLLHLLLQPAKFMVHNHPAKIGGRLNTPTVLFTREAHLLQDHVWLLWSDASGKSPPDCKSPR